MELLPEKASHIVSGAARPILERSLGRFNRRPTIYGLRGQGIVVVRSTDVQVGVLSDDLVDGILLASLLELIHTISESLPQTQVLRRTSRLPDVVAYEFLDLGRPFWHYKLVMPLHGLDS